MSTTTMPKVGDTVRADYIPSITGTSDDKGATGMAVNVDRIAEDHPYTGRDGNRVTGTVCYADFSLSDGTVRRYYFSEWTPVIEEIPATPEASVAPEAPAEPTEIDRLKRELSDIRHRFQQSMTMISEVMNEEAENRGWCETFDGIIDSLNRALPGPFYIDERESEHTVTVTINYSGSFTYDIDVTARTFDSAVEAVNDDPSAYFDVEEAISHQVRNYGVDDYEVESY